MPTIGNFSSERDDIGKLLTGSADDNTEGIERARREQIISSLNRNAWRRCAPDHKQAIGNESYSGTQHRKSRIVL